MAEIAELPVLILAGGLGTRLRAVHPDLPKPLVPVGDKPFLEILVRLLAGKGFREFHLSTGYKGEMIREALSRAGLPGAEFHFHREEKPLGTGGALPEALEAFRPRALVLNGDTYLDIDYAGFFAEHRANRKEGSLCTLALARVEDTSRFGRVLFEGNRLTGFLEKAGDPGGGGWINGGAYLMERELVLRIRKGAKVSLEKEVFPGALREGIPLHVFRGEGRFFDIGTPESLEEFRRFYGKDRPGTNPRPPA